MADPDLPGHDLPIDRPTIGWNLEGLGEWFPPSLHLRLREAFSNCVQRQMVGAGMNLGRGMEGRQEGVKVVIQRRPWLALVASFIDRRQYFRLFSYTSIFFQVQRERPVWE